MPNFKNVSHVIFDLDGLLIDTESLYFNIFSNIAAKYEKTYGWDTYMKLMGSKERDSARTVIEDLQLPMTVDEFVSEQYSAQKILFPQVQLMPGAERLVRHLHENSIPIAVATSSALESVELKTSHHNEVMRLFHHLVSATSDPEVERGKPAPDVFLVCASRFDDRPDPSMCLVFEDAPNGVTAARAAGMQVVMVPDHRISEELRKNATMVIPSLEHFKPELFGLPPFKQQK